MGKKLIPFLFLLLSGRVQAYEFPIEVAEYIDDVKIVAYLDKKDVNNTSQWVPFEGQPPLSIYDALQAVQKYIISNAEFVENKLIGIELKRIPHHEKNWHYLVKVKYKLGDKMQPHFFVVLMDGKVISALRKPESIK